MPRSDFIPVSARPIRGQFDPPQLVVPGELAPRLAFDPGRLGSQFYPNIGEERRHSLLQSAASSARKALAALGSDALGDRREFAFIHDAGKSIGFDALLPLEQSTGAAVPISSTLLGKLGLGPRFESGFAPPLAGVIEPDEGPGDDELYDPFFQFLMAPYLQVIFRRSEEPAARGVAPSFTMIAAEPSANKPGALLLDPPKTEETPPMGLIATPAQRLILHELFFGKSASKRFSAGGTRLPLLSGISLKKQAHPSGVRDYLKLLTAAAPAPQPR